MEEAKTEAVNTFETPVDTVETQDHTLSFPWMEHGIFSDGCLFGGKNVLDYGVDDGSL